MLEIAPIQSFKTIKSIALRSGGLTALVGNTPLLPLRSIPLSAGISPDVQVLVKAEWFNPGGSIKDRPALEIIERLIASGSLRPGIRLLDSTSGNMGIAYATFSASMGLPLTLTIPENASRERVLILQSLGAEIILTDPLEGSDGAIRKAREMVQAEPGRYLYLDQYNNPANWQAHYRTTGPEIYEQTAGQVTHFLAGLGTSGTLTGTGRFLRSKNPDIRLISIQPDSPFHGLEGLKHMASAIVPGIYDPDLADRNLSVQTEASYAMVRRLAREEGLFVGISSGAAAVAALRIAQELDRGVVVTIFPDSGAKYLSDPLWINGKGDLAI